MPLCAFAHSPARREAAQNTPRRTILPNAAFHTDFLHHKSKNGGEQSHGIPDRTFDHCFVWGHMESKNNIRYATGSRIPSRKCDLSAVGPSLVRIAGNADVQGYVSLCILCTVPSPPPYLGFRVV